MIIFFLNGDKFDNILNVLALFQIYYFINDFSEKIKHSTDFDLYEAVRSVMYRSVVHMFFGEGSIPVKNEVF